MNHASVRSLRPQVRSTAPTGWARLETHLSMECPIPSVSATFKRLKAIFLPWTLPFSWPGSSTSPSVPLFRQTLAVRWRGGASAGVSPQPLTVPKPPLSPPQPPQSSLPHTTACNASWSPFYEKQKDETLLRRFLCKFRTIWRNLIYNKSDPAGTNHQPPQGGPVPGQPKNHEPDARNRFYSVEKPASFLDKTMFPD